MSTEMQDSIRTLAIEWHIWLLDGDDATWDSFVQWLEEDPRHARAYDLIEQTDLAIEPLLPELLFREAANDADEPIATPSRKRPLWWASGGLVAASIAAAIVVAPQLRSERYEVVTGPGEHRNVALDTSTQIALNGSTTIILDRKNPRFASLVSGEALFRVHHDEGQPFTLEVGDNRIQNIGTVFDVVHVAGEVRVAVAEGKVLYNPGKQGIALDAGQALVDSPSGAPVRIADTPSESVGAWQKGQLIYSGEPLSRVAADLSRSLGVPITESPSIADRPFSGTIALNGTGPEQLRRLGPALNVVLEKGPGGWMMKPLGSEGR